jgi:hypothetical protein
MVKEKVTVRSNCFKKYHQMYQWRLPKKPFTIADHQRINIQSQSSNPCVIQPGASSGRFGEL